MTNSEQNYLHFENELRNNFDESAIDYLAVASKLIERIQAAERFGELSVLKTEVILSTDFFESIEKNLTAQISNYREYEEPIDECIQENHDLSQAHWERLEHKLDEKIRDVRDLPSWETVLKAPVFEPLPEGWECIEQKLLCQITRTQYQPKWELCTKSDEVVIPGEAEQLENLVQERIEHSELASWEQVIRSEEVLPYKKWEEYEEQLFAKLQDVSDLPKQPFWYIIEHYLTLKGAGVLAALLVFVMLGSGGYFFVNRTPDKLTSVVYQMQGIAASHPELSSIQNGSYSSVQGGSVTFVNDHGSVSLNNETRIELPKVTRKEVVYRIHFRKDDLNRNNSSNIVFFVKESSSRDLFKVETPDYDIVVKGTYFTVEPDLSGRVTTRVLEGAVKISSSEFGDTLLSEGQSIFYDLRADRYAIRSDGLVIPRDKLEMLPDADELIGYKGITINTGIDLSEVFIDGQLLGYAPITIRQPEGARHIKVRAPGYAEFDSLIQLNNNGGATVLELKLKQNEKAIVKENTTSTTKSNSQVSVVTPKPGRELFSLETSNEGVAGVEPVGAVAMDHAEPFVDARSVESRPVDTKSVESRRMVTRSSGTPPAKESTIDDTYYAAQKAEIKGNWKLAVLLYGDVFGSHYSSKLKKEAALFSIGKLCAEHDVDMSEAKEVFLKYLALYPEGSFSGECWLRLAELEFASNPEKSIQYYAKFFEMFPRHPRISELQHRVGIIYLQTKRYREAVSMFKQALSNSVTALDSERRQIYANLYRALEESGDTEAAAIVKKEMLVRSR